MFLPSSQALSERERERESDRVRENQMLCKKDSPFSCRMLTKLKKKRTEKKS